MKRCRDVVDYVIEVMRWRRRTEEGGTLGMKVEKGLYYESWMVARAENKQTRLGDMQVEQEIQNIAFIEQESQCAFQALLA